MIGVRIAPVRPAPTSVGSAVVSRSHVLSLRSRLGSGWDRQSNDGAVAWSRSYVQAGPDQVRSLAHELKAEVAPASSRRLFDIETPAVVGHFEDPSSALKSRPDRHAGGTGVLADILKGLLGDPQDHGPLDVGERLGWRSQVVRDRRPGDGPDEMDSVA